MKKLSLLTLSLFTAISLDARENPFVPTNAYEEEKARIIEQNSLDAQAAQEAAYIKEMQKMMESINSNNQPVQKSNNTDYSNSDHSLTPDILKPKVQISNKEDIVTKDEVKKLIKEVEKENAEKTQKIVQKELQKVKEEQITKEVVFVKPRTDVQADLITLNPLPFLEISYDDETIKINTKYDMKKTFNLEKEKKIIIDFTASTRFSTKNNSLDSSNFRNIIIGNHREKGFFRVVVKTSNKPSSYSVSDENGTITISKN